MAKVDDAGEAIRNDNKYIEPEEFFSNPPSAETIKQWTDSLTGFEVQTTVSAESEIDLKNIRLFYNRNKEALEQYAEELPIPRVGQSTPGTVLFMVYIRILQSKYAGKTNLNPHKLENLLNHKYSVENTVAESSASENELTKEFDPSPLREIDPTFRDMPESEEDISYESSKKRQTEATNIHEQTVGLVSAWLTTNAWRCKKTEETDILATRDERVLVAEVKSIDGQNNNRQIRKALGQLHENCYRDVVQRGWDERTLIPIVVLTQRPVDGYMDYLEYLRRRGIETLWVERDEINGLPNSVDRIS